MTTNYDVRVRRDGRFWYLEIPALDGATQARNLAEVHAMARDYIASVTETDPESFTITQDIELPANAREHLTEAQRLRAEEAHARSQAAEESRAAATALKDSGLTIREVGQLLGVSHQRVHQLISSPR